VLNDYLRYKYLLKMSKTQQILLLEPPVELRFKGVTFDWCHISCALHCIIISYFLVS